VQSISTDDKEAIFEVLSSDYLTQGPVVPRFESEITKLVGANFGVAVNSATSALQIACLSLGVGRNDKVWTTPNSFVATANSALMCGADVDFVDIDPITGNLCAWELEKKLVTEIKSGNLPKVVIPVHFAGQPTNQERIWSLAQEFGFKVIEDASHSLGGMRNGNKVGSCRYSDITGFSFHAIKMITTGEGGMAVTNNYDIEKRMRLFRSHGVTRNQSEMVNHCRGPWYYEQIELGMNYRMTDIQAALGVSQLDRLNQFVVTRNELANYYDELFENTLVNKIAVTKGNYSSRHLYVIRVSPSKRLSIYNALRNYGFGVNVHYMPIHLHPYYKNLGFKKGQYKKAEEHGKEALSLPLHPKLLKSDPYEVASKVHDLIQ